MQKFSRILLLLFLVAGCVIAEDITLPVLIDKAIDVSPTLRKAELDIENTEIELQRLLYKEDSLPKNTLEQRKRAVEDAYKSLETTKEVVVENVIKAVLQLLKAQNQLRQKEIALLQARRDLEIAVVKFERGQISLNDLSTAEDKVVSSVESYESAFDNFNTAREHLANLTKLEFTSATKIDFDLEPLILDVTLEDIIIAKKSSDSLYLQSLKSVEREKTELEQMIEDDEAKLTIRQKEIALEKTQIDLDVNEKAMLVNAKQSFASYENTKKRLLDQSAEVKRVKDRLLQGNKQYDDGLITLNELEDIKYQLEIAEMKLEEAKWELHIASIELKRLVDICGR